MKKYQVVVGNVGHVYDGNNKREAMRIYRNYIDKSKDGDLHAHGEPVTMFAHGVISAEYFGKLEWL